MGSLRPRHGNSFGMLAAENGLDAPTRVGNIAQSIDQIFLETMPQEGANFRWSISWKSGPIGVVRDRRFDPQPFRVTLEGRTARQYLEKNAAERKDIRAPIHWTAEGLLRAHVTRCSRPA